MLCLAWIGPAGPAAAQDEIVGPGDSLKVEVFGEADLSGTFVVQQDGALKINWVEPVPVAGKSVEAVAEAIRAYLDEKYVINPHVSVTIADYKSRTVSLMGEVGKPGLYRLGRKTNLLSVLLDAGGPTQQAGDEVVILREKTVGASDYDTLTSSLQRLLKGGDPADNPVLQPGDVIYVAGSRDLRGREAGDSVYVLGAVKSGGSFRFRKGYTALDAVIDAGGVTKFASPNGTKIFRGQSEKKEVISVKLGDVLNKGDRSKNVELAPGDLIIVPQSFL